MQILTKEIERVLAGFPIGSQDGKRGDALVAVKLFYPWGRYSLYVTEGEKQGDEWILYGWCVSPIGGDCDEWGYANLRELMSVRGQGGLGLERDRSVRAGKQRLRELVKDFDHQESKP